MKIATVSNLYYPNMVGGVGTIYAQYWMITPATSSPGNYLPQWRLPT